MSGLVTIMIIALSAFTIQAEIDDIFGADMDDVFGRGLMASAPPGDQKFMVTIKSSKSKADVEANADAIKSALATDLFGGKVEAAQITLAVADARRRLLAGSTITATVTTDATTFAALTTAYKTNAAAFQTKYASTYGVTSLASNDVAAAKVALAVVAALAVMAAWP